MIVLNGEGLECEVHVDDMQLDHVSEFKYLGCVLDDSSIDEAVSCRKVPIGVTVAGTFRSLVNRAFQFECAVTLHETLLILVLMHGSEKILWKERKRIGLGLVLYRWTTTEFY